MVFTPGKNLPNIKQTLFAYHVDLNVGGGGFSFWELRSEEGRLCRSEALVNVHVICASPKSQECPLARWLVGAGQALVLMGHSWASIFQWCAELES